MFDVFLCFATFPYGVLGQVWYLIVSNPDFCLLPYLVTLACEDETHDVQQNKFSPNEIHLVKWDFNRFLLMPIYLIEYKLYLIYLKCYSKNTMNIVGKK